MQAFTNLYKLNGAYLATADINKDGKINILDATHIQKTLAKIINYDFYKL